jgi:uncharacterized protein YndB with AHSA1/START domain
MDPDNRLSPWLSTTRQHGGMRITHSADIPASIEKVWRVYTDVERWPQWMESMEHVDLAASGGAIEGEPLQLGSQVWIAQPRLPNATWEVTELTPGRSWTWVSRSTGATSTATDRASRKAMAIITNTMSNPLPSLRLEKNAPMSPPVSRVQPPEGLDLSVAVYSTPSMVDAAWSSASSEEAAPVSDARMASWLALEIFGHTGCAPPA